jgi:biopolymer transport protein ExbD
MKKISRSRHHTLNELNITPLLDLVFVLLVIFIITTPQLVNNLEMTLPSGGPVPQEEKESEIHRIAVDAEGRIFLNGRPIDVAQLRETLLVRTKANPELAVVLDGSDEAAYQGIIDVLDVLQQLNIERVGLATVAKARRP